MSKKVTAYLRVKVILNMNEGVTLQDTIDEMDYSFNPDIDHADLVDSEIESYEIIDSK